MPRLVRTPQRRTVDPFRPADGCLSIAAPTVRGVAQQASAFRSAQAALLPEVTFKVMLMTETTADSFWRPGNQPSGGLSSGSKPVKGSGRRCLRAEPEKGSGQPVAVNCVHREPVDVHPPKPNQESAKAERADSLGQRTPPAIPRCRLPLHQTAAPPRPACRPLLALMNTPTPNTQASAFGTQLVQLATGPTGRLQLRREPLAKPCADRSGDRRSDARGRDLQGAPGAVIRRECQERRQDETSQSKHGPARRRSAGRRRSNAPTTRDQDPRIPPPSGNPT